MPWIAAAVLASGYLGSQASGDAADAQVQGNQNAINADMQRWKQMQANLAPWRTVGSQAQNRLALMLGIDPGTRTQFDENAYLSANPRAANYFASPEGQAYRDTGKSPYDLYQEWQADPRMNNMAGQPTAGSAQNSPYWQTGIRQAAPSANALRMSLLGR